MYKNDWALSILFKETNPVVTTRAKTRLIVFNRANKATIIELLTENNLEPEGLVYLGNDLNDLPE